MMKFALIVAGIVHSTPKYAERPEFAPNIVLIELPEGSPVQAACCSKAARISLSLNLSCADRGATLSS
ncbi:MAG: hypothetical protein IBJ08_04300 [Pseudomonas sp.]|nr:hypothetical protein [Pseudomonas sp.]